MLKFSTFWVWLQQWWFWRSLRPEVTAAWEFGILHVNYILCIIYDYKYVPWVLMLSHTVWRHNNVMLCDVTKRRRTVWRVNFSTFSMPKWHFFNISLGAQLAYKIYPTQIYREWPNLNTVKISFCKVVVPLVKFPMKDLKMTEKHQNKATLPIFSTL